MKVNIVKREKNPLLKREELEFTVEESKGVPSRKNIVEKLAAQTNAKAGAVVVKKVETVFGSKDFQGKANVYETPEDLKKVEPDFLMARTEGKKKAGEAKPAEEKKEEKPAEEKKEEAPKEEKKEEAPKEEKKEEKKE